MQTAYDAYLAVVDSQTGISEIESNNSVSSAIYDLQGRRVAVANKGIYIINGKKVVK